MLAYQYLLSGITGTTIHAKLQFSGSPSSNPRSPDLSLLSYISLSSTSLLFTFTSELKLLI
jgi:hypothetical protein